MKEVGSPTLLFESLDLAPLHPFYGKTYTKQDQVDQSNTTQNGVYDP
jgi:hypothetical protein